MENSSKKHHYVPQYLPKNFGIGKKKRQINVFDKSKNCVYKTSVTDTGSENHFNRLKYKNTEINFESVFGDVDNIGASIIKKIIQSKSINQLGREDLSHLSSVVAVQIFRTKIRRSSFIELSKELAERCREIGYAEADLEELNLFDDNESKLAALLSLQGVDEITNLLSQKDIILLENKDPDNLIWISDNPVVMYNVFPYGREGLAEKGIEVYFPISPNFCIAFYCPSFYIGLKESFSPSHPRPYSNDPWLKKVFQGMETNEPVSIDNSVVTYLNELQIRSSSRFIYSQTNNFSLAINYLDQMPELREVKTRHQLGKLGEAPPASTGMPPGEFVVFHGRLNHHILSVFNIKQEKVGFRFITSDNIKLKLIEADTPFSRVELYVNRQLRTWLNEATLERLIILDPSGQSYIRIKYLDEGLNKFFEKI
jgi:Protein of unknown function (DUF4238)